MSNMSYCRYQNTRDDLRDCSDAMFEETAEDIAEMDDEELEARNELIRICQEIDSNFQEKEREED